MPILKPRVDLSICLIFTIVIFGIIFLIGLNCDSNALCEPVTDLVSSVFTLTSISIPLILRMFKDQEQVNYIKEIHNHLNKELQLNEISSSNLREIIAHWNNDDTQTSEYNSRYIRSLNAASDIINYIKRQGTHINQDNIQDFFTDCVKTEIFAETSSDNQKEKEQLVNFVKNDEFIKKLRNILIMIPIIAILLFLYLIINLTSLNNWIGYNVITFFGIFCCIFGAIYNLLSFLILHTLFKTEKHLKSKIPHRIDMMVRCIKEASTKYDHNTKNLNPKDVTTRAS